MKRFLSIKWLFVAMLFLVPCLAFAESESPSPPTLTFQNPSAFRGSPSGLAWAAVLVGFATAASIQLVKELWARGSFHRHAVRRWVEHRANVPGAFEVTETVRITAPNPGNSVHGERETHEQDLAARALNELHALVSGEKTDSKTRFVDIPAYVLPAEQLCGQLASAAEATIAAPDEFRHLFAVLVAGGSLAQEDNVKAYVQKCVDRKKAQDEKKDELSAGEQRYGDLRAQYMIQAQRALDNLQIQIGQKWRGLLALACLVVSVLFSCCVVSFLLAGDAPFKALSWFERFETRLPLLALVTMAGALAAPIAHDLIRAVRSFRRS